jgi:hypothetical protein
MRHLKKFNESKHNGLDKEEIEEIKSIFLNIIDDYDIEFREVDYFKYFPSKRDSKKIDAFSIYIEDSNNRIQISQILEHLKKLQVYLDDMECDMDIEPNTSSNEFISLDDFIEFYGDDELWYIDIIVYKKSSIEGWNQ